MSVNYANLYHHILSDALNSNDYCNYCEQVPNWIICAGEDTDEPNWIIWPHYLAWGGQNTWLASLEAVFFSWEPVHRVLIHLFL